MNKRIVEKYEKNFLGEGEPAVNPLNYKLTFMEYMNYHTSHTDDKDKRKWTLQYLKNTNIKDIHIYDKAPDYYFTQIGPMCKLINKAVPVADEHVTYVKNKLEEIYKKYSVEVEKKKPNLNILLMQGKIKEQINTNSEVIDHEIDKFITNKTSSFSTKSYLLKNGVSGSISKKIADNFRAMLAEASEALSTADQDLIEGYSFFNKAEHKRFITFLDTIINDCLQHGVTERVVKPKTVKVKPAGVIVAKMKYQFNDESLSLKSIDPKTIINASELWVYNTLNKKLVVYHQTDDSGLGVRGTTITNYDVSKSQSKTLRKPDIFFKDLNTAKKAMRENFTKLTTKETIPNGRINETTILLKVY